MKLTTASKITILRVLLIPVVIVLMYLDFEWHMYCALAVFVIASASDFVDGYIARHCNQVSNFGKFLDPLADKLLVISVMLVFVDTGLFPAWVAIIVVARELAVTGLRLVAVEGGTVEALGWNQYGGWRVGIRSDDGRRYYYYAHLRKDKPFAEGLREGDTVKAGQLIGYLGMTGYSSKENVNNINTPHLHFGIQLIFDESQKECDNEIWINLYPITLLLEKNKSEVCRISETKEFYSISSMQEIAEKNS